VNPQLEIAIITAAAAVAGSLAGAFASFLGSKALHREQWRVQQIEKQIAAREQLYSDFIAEATRLGFAALDTKADKAAEFVLIYSLLSRIKLLATQPVITAADQMAKFAVLAHGSDEAKPKPPEKGLAAPFSTVCRKELDDLRATI
jgi:hypothetical protein